MAWASLPLTHEYPGRLMSSHSPLRPDASEPDLQSPMLLKGLEDSARQELPLPLPDCNQLGTPPSHCTADAFHLQSVA